MLEQALIKCAIDDALKELKDHGRIDDIYVKQFHAGVDSQDLVIGIIGKMKAGKSSLANAVIFGDNILPSGSQPITVTLTEITYAPQEEVEVELLTLEDINNLRTTAQYSGDDKSLIDKAEIAQATIEGFPSNYEELLKAQRIRITLPELTDFVSSNGTYSGLAKHVKIKIANQNLKGITIIDTPGFNDPILSRGETTRQCLSHCNVILFVHNQDGYDQIDETLLREQIEYAGISEILDVYNKIDLLYLPFAEWDEQKEYFIEKRNEYVQRLAVGSNIYGVITNAETILISSLMALCGLIDSNKRTDWIKRSRSKYQEDYQELCNISGGETLDESLVQYSNINILIEQINRISRNKTIYLSEAPLATLKGKLDLVIEMVNSEINECKTRINSYQTTVNNATQELAALEEFMNRVSDQIRVYHLEERLYTHLNQVFSKLCSVRSDRSIVEFTKENYPEPDFIGTKIEKQNVARYNLFVSLFENIIRDQLGHYGDGCYGLIGSYKNEINEYVNSIISQLVTNHVSAEKRELFKQGLLKELLGKLLNLSVIITSHTLSQHLSSTQLQWSLYKTKFENSFTDEYFNKLLSNFREIANELGDPTASLFKIQKLHNTVIEEMSLSPAEKETAIATEKQKLSELKTELELYIGMREKIIHLINQNKL